MNKYGLNLKIKKEGLTSENIKFFADLYNLNFLSSNDLSFVSEQYFNDKNIKILKFINDVKENFSKERYLKYLEFSKTHFRDSSSLDFFIAKYGENLGKQKFDEKGNIDNLQMLPHSVNSSKSTGSYSMIQYCTHRILGERINDFKF